MRIFLLKRLALTSEFLRVASVSRWLLCLHVVDGQTIPNFVSGVEECIARLRYAHKDAIFQLKWE